MGLIIKGPPSQGFSHHLPHEKTPFAARIYITSWCFHGALLAKNQGDCEAHGFPAEALEVGEGNLLDDEPSPYGP